MRSLRILILSLCSLWAMESTGATLSPDPALEIVDDGQTFSLNITISNVTDLNAFQFDIGFNPLILNAIGTTEGSFLALGGPTFFLHGTIDNTFGTIAFI